MKRTKTVPALVLVLGLAAILTITLLQQRSAASRDAELKLAQVQTALNRLQNAPFRSSPRTGGSPAEARSLMRATKSRIDGTLSELRRDSPPPDLLRVAIPLRSDYAALDAIFAIGASGADFGPRADRLAGVAGRAAAQAAALLESAGREYGRRAAAAQRRATIGSAAAILLLLAAFGVLYRRSSRAGVEVERSEEKFRTLVANIPGAVYRRAADDDWSMQFVSDTIGDITGHPAAEFLNGTRTYAGIVDPAHRASASLEMTTCPERDAFSVDYPVMHADGTTRWVRDRGHPVRDASGAILWLDGTISDITDVKRLEQERERIELELRLAQRLEAVGQLAAGIAHEINTPIQFVGDSVGFLDASVEDLMQLVADYRELCGETIEGREDAPTFLARMRAAEDSADLEYLGGRIPEAFARARDGLARVAAIVGAMRHFARAEQFEQAPADVNEALRSTLVVAQSEYKYVAEVETALGNLPPVLCNIGEINQVFLNLIVNAAHAIGEAVRGEDSVKGVIRIRTAQEGDKAVIAISDTGPGIPDEIRERIFDPFFTTKEVGRGTGQGLAISRSIVVDKHGGSLTLDSEPGHGATFTVRLPIVPADVPVAA